MKRNKTLVFLKRDLGDCMYYTRFCGKLLKNMCCTYTILVLSIAHFSVIFNHACISHTSVLIKIYGAWDINWVVSEAFGHVLIISST